MNSQDMTTLTTEQAIELVPAIGATTPSTKVSPQYQFVSSRDILNRVQQDGWRITNASSQGQKECAQHRVTLVHQNDLDNIQNLEGIPRMEMFNSHNRTKRLMFAVGYFRFVCSNGLIVASGPAETIRTKHRFSDDKLSAIMEQVANISNRFPLINNKIEQFKERQLTEEEQVNFAQYALKGRYNYRPVMPKRFRDVSQSVERILNIRREQDAGNSAWAVYNRVQENLVSGIQGYTRAIRGYSDSVRVNQLLWKGAETTLQFEKQELNNALVELLTKDGKKGKISA
jgi:hypothetical protein